MTELINSAAKLFASMFGYDFFTRALVVGILVSLCASLLGSSLVLKRYSMIGDGLSHVGFGSLAVAASLGWAPIWFSIPVVVVVAVFLLRISQNGKLKGDALIALISSSALAFGLIILSVSEVKVDINSYMFGSILALDESAIVLSVICSAFVLVLYVFFYNKIFSVTFDESFSKATGIKVGFYNLLLALLTAVVIVVGMQLMGALLISSLVIFPSLTAMRVCKSFKAVSICSVLVSVICFFIGLVLTFLFPLPTGACIVITNLGAFIIFAIVGKIKEMR